LAGLEGNTLRGNRTRAITINPFKLFYYRKTAGITIEALSKLTAISVRRLKRYERGTLQPQGQQHQITGFTEIDEVSLRRIEAALNCKGRLRGGQNDDFGTQFLYYYEVNKHQGVPAEADSKGPAHEGSFAPRAIVFDFDGTLSRRDDNRTTWERLWTQLGYTDNECGKLVQRFFRKEIDHDQWCRLTLEKFKARGLRQEAVFALGKSIKLIDGFETTIKQIKQAGIPMYIVSGSIWDVVIAAIGEFAEYFNSIEANAFVYTPDGVIAKIVGTRFDFEGKADFIKKVADDLHIPTSQVLFIGNSINDEQVKKRSGAKTLLVNPHYTAPSEEWDAFIPHMNSLEEILPYLGLEASSLEQQTVTAASKAEQIIALLKNEEIMDLDKYTVVGGYRRFNQNVRADLIKLCQQITTSLTSQSSGRQNYLICAAPGSGKTYFIEEIANSLGGKIKFIAIDLSKDNQEAVRRKLDDVTGETACLCMIDEIDGRAEEQWPYDIIYKKLDINETAQATTVFALIGSSGGDPNRLREAIRPRYKAKDLIDRIPDNSKYSIKIPPLELGDGVCVYVSKILEASARKGVHITHVEKMAIFHAAMTALHSPRQIKMLADHAIDRMRGTNAVLLYDHHFDPGDGENKRFWGQYKNAVDSLRQQTIRIGQ
jgi:phosphoserine phosphatase